MSHELPYEVAAAVFKFYNSLTWQFTCIRCGIGNLIRKLMTWLIRHEAYRQPCMVSSRSFVWANHESIA